MVNTGASICGSSTAPLYITGTSGTAISTTGIMITSARKTRAPYKKDKFNLRVDRISNPTAINISTVGKVLTLNEIGKILDNLDSSDELKITIHKEPR